jgi:ABC-type multidrug transport system fused ATPase/permease subunit
MTPDIPAEVIDEFTRALDDEAEALVQALMRELER